MASTFIEDLSALTAKFEKGEGKQDELKKEGQVILKDLKDTIENDATEFNEEDLKGALAKLDTAMETESVTKEDVTAYHAQVKDLLSKAFLKKEEEEEEKDPAKAALAKADLTDEQRAEIETILKAEAERVEKAEKERETRIEKAEKEATAAREEIRKMQIEAEHRTWVEKAAKQWAHLALDAGEMGQLFMDLRDIQQVTKDKLMALLDSCEEQVKKSKFFEEIGSSIPSEGSPEGKVDALAKELITKSTGKLSMVEAQAEIWKAHPELMKEYASNKAGGE